MPVLWRNEVQILCSKHCGLMPLTPQPLPLYFSPSGQTVFMLLDEWKKREMELLLAVTF